MLEFIRAHSCIPEAPGTPAESKGVIAPTSMVQIKLQGKKLSHISSLSYPRDYIDMPLTLLLAAHGTYEA